MQSESRTKSRRQFLVKSAVITTGISLSSFSLFAIDDNKNLRNKLPHFKNSEDISGKNNLRRDILFGEKPFTLEGRVYGPDREIIRGATVRFWHNDVDGKFHDNKLRGQFTASNKGGFYFKSYKPGKYITENKTKTMRRAYLYIEAPGYEPQLSTIYFDERDGAYIDSKTYERSGIIPRPSIPQTKTVGGELVVKYDIYLKRNGTMFDYETTEPLSLSVYPNPAVKQAYLDIDGNELGDVKLAIFDLYGKKLKSYRVPNEGNRQVSLNVKDLEEGTYLIRIESQKRGAISQKLVISR